MEVRAGRKILGLKRELKRRKEMLGLHLYTPRQFTQRSDSRLSSCI
jgi:hypothetical protein